MRIGLGAPTALLAAVLLLTIAPEALAVPGNDDLADASDVTALPFVDDVDPVDATVEPGEPSCSTPADINTVWYRFTPSVSGMIRLSAAGLVYFPTIAVFERFDGGVGFSGLSIVRCGYAGPTNVRVESGRTYYVKVGFGWWETWSIRPYSLRIEMLAPPANDAFADATVVTSFPYVDGVDATAATLEHEEPRFPNGGGFINASVWYAFTPSSTMSLEANFDGSGLGVYTGTSLDALTPVRGTPGPFRFTFEAVAGTRYYLQLSPFGFDSAGSATRVAMRLLPGDTTPPDIIRFVNGAQGANGWYVSNVSLSWSVIDVQSQVTATTGCGFVTVTEDTAGTTFSCTATSVGGSRTRTITIRRDASPPVLVVPQRLEADAASPEGATVASYPVSATDNLAAPGELGVACSPAAPAAFAVGDGSATCTATDQAGNSTTRTFVVHIRSAREQLPGMIDRVRGLGPGASLVDKLTAVAAAIDDGDAAGACGGLLAFLNGVRAQSGKSIPLSLAVQLGADALRIQHVLDC
jgi:hypothetical protein